MPTAFTLTIDTAAAHRIGVEAAFREVTDTTRHVLNRAIVLTPVDTGRLRGGNQMRVSRTATGATGDVWNPTSYAPFVHENTRAHTVRPRNKKVLRFVADGKVIFAKSARIPARRGRPWLYRALVEIARPRGYAIGR